MYRLAFIEILMLCFLFGFVESTLELKQFSLQTSIDIFVCFLLPNYPARMCNVQVYAYPPKYHYLAPDHDDLINTSVTNYHVNDP